MDNSPVHRQHEETTLPELYGKACTEVCAVRRERDARYGPMYLQLSGAWHRFHLDAGLLFWREGSRPDPEDELLDGETIVDLTEQLRIRDVRVTRIEMSEGRLLLEFENGSRLVFHSDVQSDGAELVECRVRGSQG